MGADELEAATRAIRAAFGDEVQIIDSFAFSSGALSITIRRGTSFAVLDGHPSSRWGVSFDPDHGFTGNDRVVDSLAEVVDLIRRRWATGALDEAEQAGSAPTT
ncbi:hypothetical protein [Pseudonocardia xinjiangensis]|uniref:Uncharacterized protein n=1 Tax=Pseudonocardia xinjiangensis TaxID=75289 RepID=A0ABX1RB97_9PSEU|nr:hypothetical protein [Pseudonocardia xinjiangensis]NMH76391.1 hypothetical protein [Pseudonocardia xinjiangensis]